MHAVIFTGGKIHAGQFIHEALTSVDIIIVRR